MRPRFRQGEVVRAVTAAGAALPTGSEAVVEEITGPNDEGSGWMVTLRIAGAGGGDSLVLVAEAALEPTGLVEDERGERVPLAERPEQEELRDCIELRLFTEITDGIEAARVAETIERELVELLGGATVSIEAERHWSEPYNYELGVTINPLDDPVEALRRLTAAGGESWLSCRDDGWRCDLWWSDAAHEDASLIVPEVHGAELAFLPWRSPRRRPDDERPLVVVNVPDQPGSGDSEPGDEEP
jgi:hypothetical protein